MGNFRDLPGEIALDIFSRLPTELVVDCKSVSKTWRNILRNPSFHQIHSNLLLGNHDSTAKPGKFSFIFKMNKRLYFLEYDYEVSAHKVQKLIFNPPFNIYGIVGSCNGLICIQGLPNPYISAYYVVYICNPITRESITLPEIDRSRDHFTELMSFGFGYVASSNEYKVVSLCTLLEDNKCAQIVVYTLGSDKGWRNAGKININPDSIERQNAVFVDGFLYWDSGDGKTMAFDLAIETFVEIPGILMGDIWMGVLGGYLSGTHLSWDGPISDVWLLKKKTDESLSWSKEFSIISEEEDPYTTPLAITSSGEVLCYSDSKLYLHDLPSSSSKMLQDFRTSISKYIPHINTFVSLKAFGEENTSTLEAGGSFGEESTKTLEAGGSSRNSKRSYKKKNR